MNFTKNFNFVNKNKLFYIIPAIIVAIAIVFVAVFNFNLGYDFKGGTQLSVMLGNDVVEDNAKFDDAYNKIEELLNSKKIIINSFQVQGEFDTTTFIFTYKDATGFTKEGMVALNNEIRQSINELKYSAQDDEPAVDFNKNLGEDGFSELGDTFDITRSSVVTYNSIDFNTIFITIAAIVFSIAIAILYLSFRFSAIYGLSFGLANAIDLILTLSVVAISRIEIGTFLFYALIFVLFVSFVKNFALMRRLNDKIKNPLYTNKDNTEITNMVCNEVLPLNIRIFLGAIAIVAITWVFLLISNFTSYPLGLTLVFGIVSVFYTSTFITPAFWARVARQRKLIKPAISTLPNENDKDDGAEVIEIN